MSSLGTQQDLLEVSECPPTEEEDKNNKNKMKTVEHEKQNLHNNIVFGHDIEEKDKNTLRIWLQMRVGGIIYM